MLALIIPQGEKLSPGGICLGGVSKLGRTGRIEFGSGGVPPHVLLRGHFRAQINLSAQADKRPIQSNFLISSPARPGAGEEQKEGAAPSPDFNRQVLAKTANSPPNWNAPSAYTPPGHVGRGEVETEIRYDSITRIWFARYTSYPARKSNSRYILDLIALSLAK